MTKKSTMGGVALFLAAAALAGAEAPPQYRVSVMGHFSGQDTRTEGVNLGGWSAGIQYAADYSIFQAVKANRSGQIVVLPIPTEFSSEAVAINNRGQVAGSYHLDDEHFGNRRVFRHSLDVGFEDIGTLGGRWGEVMDMNIHGDIVGTWSENDVTGNWKAFLYTDEDGWLALGGPNPPDAIANDVNDRGEVVGQFDAGINMDHAFHWRDGVFTDIGTLGGDNSNAYYINQQGVVVGEAWAAGEGAYKRPIRWTEQNGLEEIPLSPNAQYGSAMWVNNNGMIIGTQVVNGGERVFLYGDETGLIEVGPDWDQSHIWNAPVRVNDQGVAVFTALEPSEYNIVPFVYFQDSGLFDVNDLLVEDPGFPIHEIRDINACGEITAIAWGGFEMPFDYAISVLLTPIWASDLDESGVVNLKDFAMLQAGFGMTEGATRADGDVDGDGDVDRDDFASLFDKLESPCR